MMKAELLAGPEAPTEQTYCGLGTVPEVLDTVSSTISVEEGDRQLLDAEPRRILTLEEVELGPL